LQKKKLLDWFRKEKFEILWSDERIQYSQKNLKRRIKEKAENFTGPINNLMLFSLLYLNIDITPASFSQSKSLFQKLKIKTEPFKLVYWKNFLLFINNPFTYLS